MRKENANLKEELKKAQNERAVAEQTSVKQANENEKLLMELAEAKNGQRQPDQSNLKPVL